MLLSCVPFSLNPHSLHVCDKISTPRMTGSASRSARPYLSSDSFTRSHICAFSPAVWNNLWGPAEKPRVSLLSCFFPRCLTASIKVCQAVMCIGEGNGNPLQYSCLENPRDGGAWWAAICGVAQSRTQLKQLSSSSSLASQSVISLKFTKVLSFLFEENQLK